MNSEHLTSASLLALVPSRRGHFRMESGYHSALWLDLAPLFADSRRISPFVEQLVNALRPHRVDAVCGPLVGGAFLAQLVAQSLGAEFWYTERLVPAGAQGMFQVRYILPPALATSGSGKRVAIVDDVMSAGSALRGTLAALEAHEAKAVAAGALLVQGRVGESFFAERGVPVIAVTREESASWLPADCPLCAASVPLEQVSD